MQPLQSMEEMTTSVPSTVGTSKRTGLAKTRPSTISTEYCETVSPQPTTQLQLSALSLCACRNTKPCNESLLVGGRFRKRGGKKKKKEGNQGKHTFASCDGEITFKASATSTPLKKNCTKALFLAFENKHATRSPSKATART